VHFALLRGKYDDFSVVHCSGHLWCGLVLRQDPPMCTEGRRDEAEMNLEELETEPGVWVCLSHLSHIFFASAT
jgi:hypothetical protein